MLVVQMMMMFLIIFLRWLTFRKCNTFTYIYNNIMSLERKPVLPNARWTEYYHLKYCLYIILFSFKQSHADPSLNRKGKFFKGVARWLRYKKTAQQCRTHHTKQLERFGQDINQMSKSFIEDLYFIRRLQISHLWTEVENHLKWLAEEPILTLAEEEEAKDRVRQIVALHQKKMLPINEYTNKNGQAGLAMLQDSNQGEEEKERIKQCGQSHRFFRQQKVEAACDSELFLPDCEDLDSFYNSKEHQY